MLRFSTKAIIKQFELHQKFLNTELKGEFTGRFLIWCAQNKKTCTKESLDEFLKFFSKEDVETIEEAFNA